MRNTSLVITVPHIFSPISAISAESKSYNNRLRFKYHETFQRHKIRFYFCVFNLKKGQVSNEKNCYNHSISIFTNISVFGVFLKQQMIKE